jgi:hypothetical protein
MKQICTQIAFFCLLVIGQSVYAQNTLTISKNIPSPAPTFNAPDSVSAPNGFTSTNTGTFHDFAPGQTDTIASPWYYYPAQQSTINFAVSVTAAASGGGVTTTPTVLIVTANGDTSRASVSANFKGANDYYFTVGLASPLPANMNFRIVIIMTLTDKAVTFNTFSTDARRGFAPVNAPLPVKFAGFYAKTVSSGVSLTWNVGGEENVNGYEVQKSSDGKNFTKIGFVAASNASSYSYTDVKPGDVVYYRIKSVDNDGKYAYSTVVSVKGQQSTVVLKAFPIPAQNQLTIQHGAAGNSSKIEIVAADGRMITSVSVASGTQQTNIDMSIAKPGVYVIRFVDNANTETLKIVKQ